MNAVARSFGARVLSFVPTALATLLASRLIIENYGVLAFNSYALILSLINLIPLGNLGVGAAITSAFAAGGERSSRAERTVLTAARVLAVSAAVTAVVAMVIAGFGWWQPLLGDSSGPNLWVGLALVVYALTFLPGLGQSMLLGVHRNHWTILIQTFYNPLNALIVAAIVFSDASDSVLVLVPCASLLLVNVVTAVAAGRATHISWRAIARRLPRPRRYPGARIRSMSGPVLILTLSTPIALQSDRIVLSHVSTADAVAEYSVALQIFGPALVLIAASAQPLWPIWAQARAAGRRGPGLVRVVTLFAAAGLAVGAVLALLSGPVARLVAGSQIEISPLLALAGALGVLTAAMSQPVAMSLMYPSGLKVVVWCTLLALPLNIALSIVLGHHLGAPGPLLASFVVGIAVQALPGLVISLRRQRSGDYGDEPAAPAPSPGSRPVRQAAPAIVPYRPFPQTVRHGDPAPTTPLDAAAATAATHAAPDAGPELAAEIPAEIPAEIAPEVAPRPRPRPGGRHLPVQANADAAAALAAAVSGVAGVSVLADPGEAIDPAAPAAAVRLQPIAPFRRPRDQSHRS